MNDCIGRKQIITWTRPIDLPPFLVFCHQSLYNSLDLEDKHLLKCSFGLDSWLVLCERKLEGWLFELVVTLKIKLVSTHLLLVILTSHDSNKIPSGV
jgi:hypothetical protein